MKALVLRSWLLLVYMDLVIHVRDFKALHAIVRNAQVRADKHSSPQSLCRAVDFACVFYFKEVLCLQRSAVAALLLRRSGWPAEMMIGVQLLPFRSHAWVEIDGVTVNDKPYMRDIYQVFERC